MALGRCNSGMDPLHLGIAILPLAVYLIALGICNLTRRPVLVNGVVDTLWLSGGISGFVVAGPLDLFLPETAVVKFGGFVWIPVLLLFTLSVTLICLLMRPRLVIYNISVEQLRPLLVVAVKELDAETRWAGDSLILPKRGMQLHIDGFPPLRNVQLISVGAQQNLEGWRMLEKGLQRRLRELSVTPNPRGLTMVAGAVILLAAMAFSLLTGRQEIAQSLRDMLRL